MKTTATASSTASTACTASSARRTLTIVAAGLSLAAFTGCSAIAERATEKIVEEGVERAVEADTGEDVEIDFDSDGNFSIETDDGSFSVDEEGSFELETQDGTYTGEADENSYVINDDDGVVVEAQFDEDDGSFTLESDDGTITSGSDEGSWALWPADVSRPDFIAEGSVFGTQLDEETVWLTATGIAAGDPAAALDDYVATLEGFEDTGIEDGENIVYLSNGAYSVSVVTDPAAGYPGDSILQVSVATG